MNTNEIDIDKMVKGTPKTLAKANNNAMDIAKYLLSLDPERKYFNKKHGNFRLNTMLHISQMLYCAKYGKPLFKDDMWAYPPKYGLLNKTRQEKLSAIIHNPEIKNKNPLIYKLYEEQKIKLTEWEKNTILGIKKDENKTK